MKETIRRFPQIKQAEKQADQQEDLGIEALK